jgi:HNH/Endo VII superfamily toxin with a SHH signature
LPGFYIPPRNQNHSQQHMQAGIWWPAADSAKLHAAAQAWRDMAHALDGIQAAGQSAALSALADNQGPAMDAFAAYWQKWSSSAGYLTSASQACLAMADALERYAQAVDLARHKVEALVAEIATAVVLGVVLGVCTVGIAGGAALAVSDALVASALLVGVELSTTVATIAGVLVAGAVFGALEGMAIDAGAIQPERMLVFHDQKDFNWNEMISWGELGAAGGVVGGGFSVGLRAIRGGFAGAADGGADGLAGADGTAAGARMPDDPLGAVSPAVDDGEGNFAVGTHKDWPSPRPAGMQSHHGVMSAWADPNVPGYVADNAPTVLMPVEAHDMTRFGYRLWRMEMESRMGGSWDWTKITDAQARDLAEYLFNGADVPAGIRAQYWAQFDAHLTQLMAAAS